MLIDIIFVNRKHDLHKYETNVEYGVAFDHNDGCAYPVFDPTTVHQENTEDNDCDVFYMGIPNVPTNNFVKIDRYVNSPQNKNEGLYCEEYYYRLPHSNMFSCYAVRASLIVDKKIQYTSTISIVKNCNMIAEGLGIAGNYREQVSTFNSVDNYIGYNDAVDPEDALFFSSDFEPILYSPYMVEDVMNNCLGHYRTSVILIYKKNMNLIVQPYSKYFTNLAYNGFLPSQLSYMKSACGVYDYPHINLPQWKVDRINTNDPHLLDIFDRFDGLFVSELYVNYDCIKDDISLYTYYDRRLQIAVNDIPIGYNTLLMYCKDIFSHVRSIADARNDLTNMTIIKTKEDEVYFYIYDKAGQNMTLFYYDLCRLNLRCANLITYGIYR